MHVFLDFYVSELDGCTPRTQALEELENAVLGGEICILGASLSETGSCAVSIKKRESLSCLRKQIGVVRVEVGDVSSTNEGSELSEGSQSSWADPVIVVRELCSVALECDTVVAIVSRDEVIGAVSETAPMLLRFESLDSFTQSVRRGVLDDGGLAGIGSPLETALRYEIVDQFSRLDATHEDWEVEVLQTEFTNATVDEMICLGTALGQRIVRFTATGRAGAFVKYFGADSDCYDSDGELKRLKEQKHGVVYNSVKVTGTAKFLLTEIEGEPEVVGLIVSDEYFRFSGAPREVTSRI